MKSEESAVDPLVLREEVKNKYRVVAKNPHGEYHFHTGRPLAKRLGYDAELLESLPDAAIESFAGVANPFSLRSLDSGERVIDAGSGGGFDCFVAAHQVGREGYVVGVDMLHEMLDKSRKTAAAMGLENVEFREGLLEQIPVEDGWADVVISNGVVNLCADKEAGLLRAVAGAPSRRKTAVWRYRNGKPVPESAIRNVDLWTA
jgi:SAM-dependent methyltransferase